MQELLAFSSTNFSVYAIFNDQSFNDTLTNDIVNFEQLGPDLNLCCALMWEDMFAGVEAHMSNK